jgi:hypothetical protein
VEFDELGNDGGDFGTRVMRDAHESAEFTGSFACLGFADSGYFGDGFGYRRHTPPSCNCTHRIHCFSLILLFSDLSSDLI